MFTNGVMCRHLALAIIIILTLHRENKRTGRVMTCFALTEPIFCTSKGDDMLLVYATSVGDVYGQRFEVDRIGGDGARRRNNEFPLQATHQCPTFAERIQSM